MVADGKFQEDLFYRLNVIPIEIPPLRERRDDIPALVEHFVKKHAQRTGRRYDKMDEAVLTGLQQYDWPGNVRELENTIERAVVLSTGTAISARAVSVLGAAAPQTTTLPSLKLRQNIEWVERETIRRAIDSAAGVKKDAAELMGISQRACRAIWRNTAWIEALRGRRVTGRETCYAFCKPPAARPGVPAGRSCELPASGLRREL